MARAGLGGTVFGSGWFYNVDDIENDGLIENFEGDLTFDAVPGGGEPGEWVLQSCARPADACRVTIRGRGGSGNRAECA